MAQTYLPRSSVDVGAAAVEVERKKIAKYRFLEPNSFCRGKNCEAVL
jgi:hypothetical protein